MMPVVLQSCASRNEEDDDKNDDAPIQQGRKNNAMMMKQQQKSVLFDDEEETDVSDVEPSPLARRAHNSGRRVCPVFVARIFVDTSRHRQRANGEFQLC